jgi:aminoglycoside/choline kinase family phosphotransferase
MAASMTPPDHASAFLEASGWAGARIEPLAGDASFRRYFRVFGERGQAVLMDAPPPHEDPRPFIAVAEWLVGRGLSAPEILARDLDKGLLLLGDFGDTRPLMPTRSANRNCTPSPPTSSFTCTSMHRWKACHRTASRNGWKS